jgi:hypothetical protein
MASKLFGFAESSQPLWVSAFSVEPGIQDVSNICNVQLQICRSNLVT